MNQLLKKQILKAPRLPGIYEFYKGEHVIYVGKAKDIRERLRSYTLPKSSLSPKTAKMVYEATSISFFPVNTELEALLLESKLIHAKQPRYNSLAKDDKHPLYIKITNEDYPKILTVRREDDKKSIYFGPFPSSTIVRSVLRHLRTIFPYCSQEKIGSRPCFYHHLGLCNPCPSYITMLKNPEMLFQKKLYRKNISNIKLVLSGKIAKLVDKLSKQMLLESENLLFEQAAETRNRINFLHYITQRPAKPESLIANPNLPEDTAQMRLNSLREILHKFFPEISSLKTIEMYDIANIQGKAAVGSGVTFVDGIPEKSLYKKFKIKLKSTPDDVGMMTEVLLRRFTHKDWAFPQLIIVDGGKPQVAGAQKILSSLNLRIPLFGLAKREEEIVVLQEGKFVVERINHENPGLQLIQHIRDEAHRFAQSYHHTLMKRQLTEIDNFTRNNENKRKLK